MNFKSFFRSIIILFIVLVSALRTNAQVYDPVSWSFETKMISETEAELIIKATLEKDWHIYAMYLPSQDGPIPTTITFNPTDDYELVGETKEGKYKTEFDPNF